MQRISIITYDKELSESTESDSSILESGSECYDESDDDSGCDSYESEIDEENIWKTYTRQHKLNVNLPKYSNKPGNNQGIDGLKAPIEFFQLFFSDHIFQEICKLSDKYYHSKSYKRQYSSHKRKWKTPDLPTMKNFFGILLYMGIVKKPSLKDYWSKNNLFGTPFLNDLMSLDHFLQIRKNLHFVDEDDCDKNDFLYKVRNLIDYMIVVSRSLYNPEKVLTVDEAMIKFNGRSKLKVYMPLKPTKYGFKAYILAEASSGFVLNWQLHNGKRNSLISILDNLTDPFAGQGYRISMDRFYTTLSTVSNLTEKGFEVLACITKNRAKLLPKCKMK